MFSFRSLYLPILSLLGISNSGGNQRAVGLIQPTEVERAVAAGAYFIDVRELNEINKIAYGLKLVSVLPLSSLRSRLKEIPEGRDIIVACRSGVRSAKAARLLMSNGFVSVRSLDGGIKAWKSAGLSVKQ
jgi:rhodanese-related sulfurtransferase